MKKVFKLSFLVVCALCLLCGCGKEKNLTLSSTEIIAKLYEGIGQDNMPMVVDTEITKENMEGYIGIANLDIKEGFASEPMIGSIAHSVVVLKVNDGVDIEKAKKDIQDNVNPRKWVCVEAEQVKVLSKGNTILLVMSNNDLTPKIIANFENLK